jgi:hypothetical protein
MDVMEVRLRVRWRRQRQKREQSDKCFHDPGHEKS